MKLQQLTVKKKNGIFKEIEIVRDKIEFDLAMSFILDDSLTKQKIGYIRLPRFYSGNPGSADHVLNEIKTLKKNNVKGIIFDVRNNIGGSAGECRELISYFINEGIIMQSKSANGGINQEYINNPSLQYEGDLLVLTNSRSGSASELFSGTLQDYKRALIVGSKSTFGKGTMQNFIDLNDSENSASKFGQIKMSVALFYTASGRSPQSTGIIPDIKLLDDSKYIRSGERCFPFSLPPDALPETIVRQDVNNVKSIEQLKAKSEQRTSTNNRFILAEKKARRLLDVEERNLVSLDIDTYKEQKITEASFEKENKEIFSDIKEFEVSFDKTAFKQDSTSVLNRKRWIKQIKQDPYIYECYKIINDMIG